MTRIQRSIPTLIATGLLVVAASAAHAAPAPTDGAGSTPRPPLRIVQPTDDSILDNRRPTIEICVPGADGSTRASLEVTLDGETVSEGFTWSGDCARWRPSDGWTGYGDRHAWSDPPYDVEGWSAELRDGPHDLEVRVSLPSGEPATARAGFRIETRRTSVSLGAGFPGIDLRGFDGRFATANLLEARFGSQRASTISKAAGVLRYRSRFASVGGISSALAGSSDPGETETTLWRFAAGRRKGYGYRTGDLSFVAPYHGTSVFFGDLDTRGPAVDQSALERFRDGARVGSSFEGGVALAIRPSITIDAGYEQTAVYPHWVFWPASGSALVHGIALEVAEGISRQVARKSPRAAPIVSFILRNGISYAIHHQRRKEVNWPFGGDAALVYDGFKLSFTFTY